MKQLLTLIALTLVPLSAAAQRTGLPIESVAFANTQRVDVDASDPHGWVRLTFEGERTVRVDVVVSRNTREARAVLADLVRTTAGDLPAVGIADAGFGDDRFIAFVRENIVVVVRSDTARSDARIVDAAIRAAPIGSPDLSPVAVVLPQLPVGVPTPIEIPGVVSAHVIAHGPAVARKSRRGWIVMRTGPGEVRLETRATDRLLCRR